jgi:hypothetical protein
VVSATSPSARNFDFLDPAGEDILIVFFKLVSYFAASVIRNTVKTMYISQKQDCNADLMRSLRANFM